MPADMLGVEGSASDQHGPDDARVLVSQRHESLLPPDALLEFEHPQADRIPALVGAHPKEKS